MVFLHINTTVTKIVALQFVGVMNTMNTLVSITGTFDLMGD